MCFDVLVAKYLDIEKEYRKERQAAYRAQRAFILKEKAKNKKYKFDGVRVVVGGPVTRNSVYCALQEIVYREFMKQNRLISEGHL